MIPRLFAASGAVLLWAYARACHRTATTRRLARANLLRRVTARSTRCADCGRAGGGCDRVVTIDITPDTDHLEQVLADLPELEDLTRWQREVLRRSFDLTARPITHRDVEMPVRRSW